MFKIVDSVRDWLFNLVSPLVDKEGINTTGTYHATTFIVRLFLYGALACVLASILGFKKSIDKILT